LIVFFLTDSSEEIIGSLAQVEFYFSDSNLPRDKFLREKVEQSDDGRNDLSRRSISSSMSTVFCFFAGNLLIFFYFLGNCAVVSLALICSFSRMKSHLGLDAAVKPETVPEETVLAVAEVLRRSPVLRVSEDGNPFPSLFS
jgi:lupus La protein